LYSAALLRFQNKHPELSVQNIILIKINEFQDRERGVVINNLIVVSDVNFVKSATRIITAISRAMNGQYIFLNTKIIDIAFDQDEFVDLKNNINNNIVGNNGGNVSDDTEINNGAGIEENNEGTEIRNNEVK
jgi:hypothetical protein